MTSTIVKTISLYGDYYEIFYRDNLILRVIRYPSDTQIPREVLFRDLHETVKAGILNKLTEKD